MNPPYVLIVRWKFPKLPWVDNQNNAANVKSSGVRRDLLGEEIDYVGPSVIICTRCNIWLEMLYPELDFYYCRCCKRQFTGEYLVDLLNLYDSPVYTSNEVTWGIPFLYA